MVWREILNNDDVRSVFVCTLVYFLLCLVGEYYAVLTSKILKPLLGVIKNIFAKGMCRGKNIILGAIRFFRNKIFLFFVIVSNFIFLLMNWILFLSTGRFLWTLLWGSLFLSAAGVLAFYTHEFLDWCNAGHPVIERVFSIFISLVFYLSPAYSFYTGTILARSYFKPEILSYEVFFYVLLILLQVQLILYYCADLAGLVNKNFGLMPKIKLFLFSIIHIIQLFSNLYMLLLIFDHGALTGVVTDTPTLLCFDLTFFSAMTLLTGSTSIVPVSVWAKIIVLAETFVFAIFISIVVLGMIANDDTKEMKVLKMLITKQSKEKIDTHSEN